MLEGLPDGLPNVHIAVISSDMGAGVGINACVNFGNNGVFQYTAHSSPQGVTPVFTCTDTTLQGGATFIVNDNGTANYTAPIATCSSAWPSSASPGAASSSTCCR